MSRRKDQERAASKGLIFRGGQLIKDHRCCYPRCNGIIKGNSPYDQCAEHVDLGRRALQILNSKVIIRKSDD